MTKQYISGYLASLIATMYYRKLVDLTDNNLEDTEEYMEIVDKLHAVTATENEEYSKLSIDEVKMYLNTMDEASRDESPIQNRYYNKLENRLKVLQDEPRLDDNSLLSSIINSKIIIDTLKLIKEKLPIIKTDMELSEENINDILHYYEIIKYDYLTSNNYIENMSIRYDFRIDSLPDISFTNIEDAFNLSFMSSAKEIFIEYIIDSIEYLTNVKEENDMADILLTAFEATRIEVLISYLDKEDLIELEKTIKEVFDNLNKTVLTVVKRLIKTKREGLN